MKFRPSSQPKFPYRAKVTTKTKTVDSVSHQGIKALTKAAKLAKAFAIQKLSRKTDKNENVADKDIVRLLKACCHISIARTVASSIGFSCDYVESESQNDEATKLILKQKNMIATIDDETEKFDVFQKEQQIMFKKMANRAKHGPKVSKMLRSHDRTKAVFLESLSSDAPAVELGEDDGSTKPEKLSKTQEKKKKERERKARMESYMPTSHRTSAIEATSDINNNSSNIAPSYSGEVVAAVNKNKWKNKVDNYQRRNPAPSKPAFESQQYSAPSHGHSHHGNAGFTTHSRSLAPPLNRKDRRNAEIRNVDPPVPRPNPTPASIPKPKTAAAMKPLNLAKPSASVDTANVHPSWAAKQQAKQKQAATLLHAFVGTKTTFDD